MGEVFDSNSETKTFLGITRNAHLMTKSLVSYPLVKGPGTNLVDGKKIISHWNRMMRKPSSNTDLRHNLFDNLSESSKKLNAGNSLFLYTGLNGTVP